MYTAESTDLEERLPGKLCRNPEKNLVALKHQTDWFSRRGPITNNILLRNKKLNKFEINSQHGGFENINPTKIKNPLVIINFELIVELILN